MAALQEQLVKAGGGTELTTRLQTELVEARSVIAEMSDQLQRQIQDLWNPNPNSSSNPNPNPNSNWRQGQDIVMLKQEVFTLTFDN